MNPSRRLLVSALTVLVFLLTVTGPAPVVAADTPFTDDRVTTPGTAPSSSSPATTVGKAAAPERGDLGGWLDKGRNLWDRATGKGRSLWDKATGKVKGLWDKAGTLWDDAKKYAGEVLNLPGWISQGHLSEDRLRDLVALAKAHPERAWPAGRDIALARNAHRTNTIAEMTAALTGDYDWLECDVRLEGPLRDHLPIPGARRPITAHDSFQTNGMLFEDWVTIAKASGKGLKLDFKSSAAIDQCIAILQKAGVDEGKLIMNIGVPDPPADTGDKPGDLRYKPLTDGRLTAIRRAFPGCTINLSPGAAATPDGTYSAAQVDQMIRYARGAGRPVMFPLRAECVTREIVQALRPFGKVAIWNSPSTYDPADVAAEIAKFRGWGVDGMIDIMSAH
ncbi:MAG: FAM151 family protein [Candidatus Riflebacteria bacterium]|nr:FAM151 family protein [Candidatus Riflebacteria bacterium]